MKRLKIILPLAVVFILCGAFKFWGFFAHKRIDHMAVFTLPPPMIGFYKKHLDYITAHATDPDKRRYSVKGEAPKHYIDIDHYGKHPFDIVPKHWYTAVRQYTKDTLMAYGIVPWWIDVEYYRLRSAFKHQNVGEIIDISAEMGHYIADAHVPLHTTENYDGQMTGQKGVHAFWESRIPELFANNYDYFVGRAHYIKNPLDYAWNIVKKSHSEVDSVLSIEKHLLKTFPKDKQFNIVDRNGQTVKQYSKEFSKAYSDAMDDMVERRMQSSIIDVGSYWYTAWVDAGEPDLDKLIGIKPNPNDLKQDSTLQYNGTIEGPSTNNK